MARQLGETPPPGKSVARSVMKFLKHFRSKSKLKAQKERTYDQAPPSPWYPSGPDHTRRLDNAILKRIFSYFCPHANDETLEVCEKSMVGDGCMLCDLRDLANTCLVKKAWTRSAFELLYHSVRIDAVHYCELEEILAETRRRRSRRGDLPDVPAIRLNLLANTLKRNYHIAHGIQFLKLPYMTRETCKADLARCISACPNLVYVDLPDGCFTGEHACLVLQQELQQNCQHIKKMKYALGSEPYLEMLMGGKWPELEILELSQLRVEPSLLRHVLGSLHSLKELRCEELPWLGDEIFHESPQLPPFPALQRLVLKETPRVTADGLANYLQNPSIRAQLSSLELSSTGIPVTEIYRVLWAASSLTDLTIVESVTNSLPIDPIPPLASISLHTLNFEVMDSLDVPRTGLHAPSASYYQYLITSLQSNSLPALRVLYVRESDFPEHLTLAPPIRPFAPDSGSRNPFAGGFSQPLEVYTKGLDEQEWVFNSVTPSEAPGRRGSMSGGRPLSSYSAHKGLGSQWGGEARKSIVVGNGFGGFLAVPMDEEVQRPRTASGGSQAEKPRGSWYRASGTHERRGSRADLWR